jgi:serine O-acetyltransferase
MMNDKLYPDEIGKVILELSKPESFSRLSHRHCPGQALPSMKNLKKLTDLIREIIFPGYFGNTSLQQEMISHYLGVYLDELFELLKNEILAGLHFVCDEQETLKNEDMEAISENAAIVFIQSMPDIRRKMGNDVNALFLGDPAAKSYGEIIFSYPAIKAILHYRIAHRMVELGVPLIPRYITEMAHSETGIDIHPEACIGEYFAIDHGTGVVIGSTCIIGNHVKIYQGVTLGAKSFEVDENGNPVKGIPRHPIVEDNVVIYSGATILGRITIGKNSVIGGNVWVNRDVPANSKIVQGKPKGQTFTEGAGI